MSAKPFAVLIFRKYRKSTKILRLLPSQSSDYIKGILNLRGRIITILDLGKKLGLGSVKKNKENTNIIVNAENEHIGLLVDAISDVVSARHRDIEPAPANIGSVKGLYFQGVLKKRTS